jgi:ABC-type transporter Mla MlaB component
MSGLATTIQGLPPCCPVCGAIYRVAPADPEAAAPCPVCGHLVWFEWAEAESGHEVVIRITNDQIAPGAPGRLMRIVKARSLKKLVFDFSRVHQVTSDTLAGLVSLRRHMQSDGGDLSIRKLHRDLRDVFHILRLDQVLPIEE